MDTWRVWELVLASLEGRHDVLAPTLGGHAGAGPITGEIGEDALLDGLERALDEAGFATPHIVGNSLGGHLALRLAERGRAASVVAFAPAGGWAPDDDSYRDLFRVQLELWEQMRAAAPYAETILSTRDGRRRATRAITVNFEHIPPALLAHQLRAGAACEAAPVLIEAALTSAWTLEPEKIECPVRIVWGTEDRLLPWPTAAARYRQEWLPHADWVILDGVGHSPQLDVPLEAAQLILGFTAS